MIFLGYGSLYMLDVSPVFRTSIASPKTFGLRRDRSAGTRLCLCVCVLTLVYQETKRLLPLPSMVENSEDNGTS